MSGPVTESNPLTVLRRILKAVANPLERALHDVLPRRLFPRSLIIIIAPVVLAIVFTSYVFMERHFQLVTRRLSAAVAGEIAMMVDSLQQLNDADQQMLIASAEKHMGHRLTLVDDDVLPELETPWYSILDRTIRQQFELAIKYPFWFDSQSRPSQMEIRVLFDDKTLIAEIRRSKVLATNWHIFLVWMVGASVIFLVVAILFLRNQIRPIQRLAIAAENLGKGRTVKDFKSSGATEVRRAAAAFFDMRDRLDRYVTQRTEMLAGVSHDLRTPLTRMKLELAMMEESEAIEAMRGDIGEMEHMLDDYLAFARGEGDERASHIHLNALIDEVVTNFARKGKTIETEVNSDIHAFLRKGAMRRCITNLLENAISFAEHTKLSALRRRDGWIEIRVDDDGPGIPISERELAFRPFHRLDQSRAPGRGGSGLGLAIARDVVNLHGGELHLEDSPMGGLRARIELPN